METTAILSTWEAVHRLHVRMAVGFFFWAKGVIFNGQRNGIILIF
jgi:hypothetical protein